MEREVVRQKMPIKWNRDFQEGWCWVISGRVRVVTLPAWAVSPSQGICMQRQPRAADRFSYSYKLENKLFH